MVKKRKIFFMLKQCVNLLENCFDNSYIIIKLLFLYLAII
jgi:hypothetical protein